MGRLLQTFGDAIPPGIAAIKKKGKKPETETDSVGEFFPQLVRFSAKLAADKLAANGDSLQFVRYAPLVARLGATVWLRVPPALKRLFLSCEGVARVFAEEESAQCQFGPPIVDTARLIAWTADWVARAMPSLGKPTKYEVRDGRY